MDIKTGEIVALKKMRMENEKEGEDDYVFILATGHMIM